MNRREQIIQVVVNKIKQNNLASQISLASIAKEVNIGKSTIYEYFDSKEELLKAAFFTFIEETVHSVTLADDISTYTFEELFKNQMKRLLEAATQSRLIIETLQPKFAGRFSEQTRDEMKIIIDNIRDKIRGRFITFFEKGIEEGIVKDTMNELDGLMITNIVVGTIITYTYPNLQIEIDQVINKLYETIIKLVS